MTMLLTQSWAKALAGELMLNSELLMPNGDRTTPRLVICKCAAHAGDWYMARGEELHPCGVRHRQRAPGSACRMVSTISYFDRCMSFDRCSTVWKLLSS